MCFCVANSFFRREGEEEGPSNFPVCKYCLRLLSNVFHPGQYIFQEERFRAFETHCTFAVQDLRLHLNGLNIKGKENIYAVVDLKRFNVSSSV